MTSVLLQREIIEGGLCTNCGVCVAICPQKKILTDHNQEPYVRDFECGACSLCYDFCPSVAFDYREHEGEVFDVTSLPKWDPYLGRYQALYVAASRDTALRKRAAGGAIVTSVLLKAMETGTIDGAVVVRMNPRRPGLPESFIARTSEEILDAASSKYFEAPVAGVLMDLKRDTGRYAFVGLPCQIHGLRNLQFGGIKWLRERIPLTLALFCGGILHTNALRFLLSRYNIAESEVTHLEFRSRKNPVATAHGGFYIQTRDGREFFVEENYGGTLTHLFTLEGCLYCLDHTGEFADISVGDVWSRAVPQALCPVCGTLLCRTHMVGNPSAVIVRTEAGQRLLDSVPEIWREPLAPEDLVRSQNSLLFDKKVRGVHRMNLRRGQGLRVPLYGDYEDALRDIRPPPGGTLGTGAGPVDLLMEELWVRLIRLSRRPRVAALLGRVQPRLLNFLLWRFTNLRRGRFRPA
ncbi:MAG: Coenzyme F420 hydrogenase/dehydrogenase, beta subunit C-terminal domain [Halobacteria archaeon]